MRRNARHVTLLDGHLLLLEVDLCTDTQLHRAVVLVICYLDPGNGTQWVLPPPRHFPIVDTGHWWTWWSLSLIL
jgi:hypothetical protein